MKRTLAFCLVLSALITTVGCKQEPLVNQASCDPVEESVHVNERYPSSIEPFSADSLRVLTFESNFKDTISVRIGNQLLAKEYLETTPSSLAGRMELALRVNQEITLKAGEGCARFKLRDGYKYLYINRLADKGWTITYSNYSRGYF